MRVRVMQLLEVLAQNCQFDNPCDDLAQCSFPGEPNSELVHLKAPYNNLQDSNQKLNRHKILAQTGQRVIPPT